MNGINEISKCLKELMEDSVLSAYDVMIVNSRVEDKVTYIKAKIHKNEKIAKENGKSGLILLAGNMLSLGITLKLHKEAKSLLSYMKCKLPNFLLSLRKNSQDIGANTCLWISLPKLNRVWTYKDIYKYFELSSEQVKLVKGTKLLGYKDIIVVYSDGEDEIPKKKSTKKSKKSKSSKKEELDSDDEYIVVMPKHKSKKKKHSIKHK